MVQPQCVAICNPSIFDCKGWRSAWPKKQLPVRCNRCGSPRGNVGFLLALVGPPHNLSHITPDPQCGPSQLESYHPPSQWMYQGIWLPIFWGWLQKLSGLPTMTCQHIQPQVPLEIDVQSDGHSRLPGMLRSQGGRVGTGHRRVHCQTRPKHKNRGTVWELEVVFFLEIVNVQGRKMFFFGRKSGWTFFVYITVYIYIRIDV